MIYYSLRTNGDVGEVFVETEVPVKEIMTQDVVTVELQTSCVDAAKKMSEHGIGGIIVVDNNRPVGIVTEQDIVRKVVSKDLRPSSVLTKDVMTRRLITIHPAQFVNEASHKMFKMRIHRLPVVDEGNLVGIITDTDLLVVSTQMGEIFSELIQMNAEHFPPESAGTETLSQGICEECGRLSERLVLANGRYLCEFCAEPE